MTKILILGGSGILSLDVLNEGLRRSYDITCITRGIRDYRLPRGVNIIHGDVNKLDGVVAVSYTHLTLPTKRIV